MSTGTLKDKISRSNPFSGATIPILIILLSVLIVGGVTKLLQSDKGYISLVEELEDKTFGNRWVAAFELSKYLSSSGIPKEDIPWLQEKLFKLYKLHSEDPRTRNFLVLASSSLKDSNSFPLLSLALSDSDPHVVFSAISSLGNFSQEEIRDFPFEKILPFLHSPDQTLQMSSIAVLSTFQIKNLSIDEQFLTLLTDSNQFVRFSAAIGLLHYGREEADQILLEIMDLPYLETATKVEGQVNPINSQNVEALKLNVIRAAQKSFVSYNKLSSGLIEKFNVLKNNDSNILVRTKIEELLLQLKK